MSEHILSKLPTMFGQKKWSDCNITFWSPSKKISKRKKQKTDRSRSVTDAGWTRLGEPLPAHCMVLDVNAPHLCAQARKNFGKLELKVELAGEDEVPVTMAALRFTYTGSVDVDTALDLLRVRRMACSLQITGCPEACDKALEARITRAAAAGGGPEQAATAGLVGVCELYDLRSLLPGFSLHDGALHRLMHLCRQQLLAALASADFPATGAPVADAHLLTLLGWAFGDAPSVLSDPDMLRQLESLSAAGLGSLLASDTFATDSEASVLVLLATWLAAHPDTPAATRERLCRGIRLCHVGDPYLFGVLPRLRWFPIRRRELDFLRQYARAGARERAVLQAAAEDHSFDTSSPWYAPTRRPTRQQHDQRESVRRCYHWSVGQKRLGTAVASEADLTAVFDNGLRRVVAHGAEWWPVLQVQPGGAVAGVFLKGALPAALNVEASRSAVVTFKTGAARLEVHGWGEGGGWTEALSLQCLAHPLVQAGTAVGSKDALKLAAAPAGIGGEGASDAERLAPWVPYLKDGRLSGTLSWGER